MACRAIGRGCNARCRAFAQSFGSDSRHASSLLISLVFFVVKIRASSNQIGAEFRIAQEPAINFVLTEAVISQRFRATQETAAFFP